MDNRKNSGEGGKYTALDITAMKLMEEIVEYDNEIKMKQKWINSRIKMLHEINRQQHNSEFVKQEIVDNFLKSIQPSYPEKLQVEYKREGDNAIPLGMGSVYKDAIALPMDSGKPIALGTKEDMEMINTYSLIQKDETKEGEQITEKKA